MRTLKATIKRNQQRDYKSVKVDLTDKNHFDKWWININKTAKVIGLFFEDGGNSETW